MSLYMWWLGLTIGPGRPFYYQGSAIGQLDIPITSAMSTATAKGFNSCIIQSLN